jgi:hypothetical protein
MRHRRTEEHQKPYHVDRFDTTTFLWVIALLVLTLIDGLLTLILLEGDFEEINPAMRWLINLGPTSFILGKYALTAWGLPVLLVFRNYSLFHPRFRVSSVIPTMVGLYLMLVIYQFGLLWLSHHPAQAVARRPEPLVRGLAQGLAATARGTIAFQPHDGEPGVR